MRQKIAVSPGHLVAMWGLVIIANNNTGISVSSAISSLRSGGLLGGTIPADEGLSIGLEHEILTIEGGRLLIGNFCRDELLPVCPENEMNKEATKLILKKIILKENFEWLSYFQLDADQFSIYIPSNWQQLLTINGLLDLTNQGTIDWWKEIFRRYQKFKDGQKIQIGNVGEKLSFEFELKRLEEEKFEHLELQVKWLSLISDRFGFDIYSFRGQLLKRHFNESSNIRIEAKAQQGPNPNIFRFFISRPEWNKALEDSQCYYFYCWTGIDLPNELGNGPYIVPADALKEMMPIDRSSHCEWSECRVIINLEEYSIFGPKN